MADKKTPAAEAAEQHDAPAENARTDAAVATAAPATSVTGATPRFGRGILIGAAAAALVVGVGLGGAGGFALANALERGPALAQQGGPHGGPPQGQQGPDGGKPPQQGGGQQGPGPQGTDQQGPGQQAPGQQGDIQEGDTEEG